MSNVKKTIEIIVDGIPVAKGRPKFRRIGNFVQAYTPAKTKKAENYIKKCFQEQVKNFEILPDCAISLALTFYMPIPKSTSKKKAKEMAENNTFHTKKPDIDNLIKLVQDALNGIAWKDDGCICRIDAIKCYGSEPKTFISIYYL